MNAGSSQAELACPLD